MNFGSFTRSLQMRSTVHVYNTHSFTYKHTNYTLLLFSSAFFRRYMWGCAMNAICFSSFSQFYVNYVLMQFYSNLPHIYTYHFGYYIYTLVSPRCFFIHSAVYYSRPKTRDSFEPDGCSYYVSTGHQHRIWFCTDPFGVRQHTCNTPAIFTIAKQLLLNVPWYFSPNVFYVEIYLSISSLYTHGIRYYFLSEERNIRSAFYLSSMLWIRFQWIHEHAFMGLGVCSSGSFGSTLHEAISNWRLLLSLLLRQWGNWCGCCIWSACFSAVDLRPMNSYCSHPVSANVANISKWQV